MLRYSLEIPGVERAVFAIGGVDGILLVPPPRAGPEDLIEVWNPNMRFEGEHAEDIDVTGGIGLKAARGAMIASKGISNDKFVKNFMNQTHISEQTCPHHLEVTPSALFGLILAFGADDSE